MSSSIDVKMAKLEQSLEYVKDATDKNTEALQANYDIIFKLDKKIDLELTKKADVSIVQNNSREIEKLKSQLTTYLTIGTVVIMIIGFIWKIVFPLIQKKLGL